MNKRSHLLPFWIVLALSIGIFIGFFLIREKKVDGLLEKRLDEVLSIIDQNYVDEINEEELLENALVGVSKAYPNSLVLKKKALEQCKKVRKYGLVLIPYGQDFLATNIFPGSVPAILGINAGDRISSIRLGRRELKFDLVRSETKISQEIQIPDSLAFFDQDILEYGQSGSFKYLLFLSPGIDNALESLRSSENEDRILDLRYFSNYEKVSVENGDCPVSEKDSALISTKTRGLGRFILDKTNGDKDKRFFLFETDRFLVFNESYEFLEADSIPSQFVFADLPELKELSRIVCGEYLKKIFETLDSNKRNLVADPYSPYGQARIMKEIKRKGLKEAYKEII